ncbi:MAG: cell envelope biogenesis protein TolA [Methylovirgula sp.]
MSLSDKPGLVVSSAAHAAVLAAVLLSFSSAPKFQDAQETIPVEMVSASDLNQIMRGDKSAKEVRPKQRADKIADTTEIKPKPPLAEAKRDVPTPPSPDKKLPDPGEAEKAPPKPLDTAALSPATAAPAKPEPAKPAPKPPVAEPPQQDTEAAEPLPVPRPKVEPPKKETKTEEPKKPDPPKLKLDQIAKLLEEKKPKDPPKPAKPKSGDESLDHPRKFDVNDISRVLLSHETAQRKAATSHELEQVASLGSPTATAPRMSPSLMAQMEGWFQDRLQGCWTQPITVPPGPKYVPMIRVPLNLDGSLAGEPSLLNPPSDPAWRPLAESALRAVRKCDPLPVPARFKAYYDEWRDRIVRFNDDVL